MHAKIASQRFGGKKNANDASGNKSSPSGKGLYLFFPIFWSFGIHVRQVETGFYFLFIDNAVVSQLHGYTQN
jgi:hypothetical protein